MGSTDIDMTTILIVSAILILIFLVGLHLQIKIIKTIRQEQPMAWEINMCHSIVMIIHYICVISIETTTYIIPSLSRYTGMWFCHFGLFLRGYGSTAIFAHSLLISIYKYMFIVHDETVRKYGKDKIKKVLFWINLIHPVFASVSFMSRPYTRYSATTRCELPQNIHTNHTNVHESIGDTLKEVFFCGLDHNDGNTDLDYFFYVSNQVYCFLQAVIGGVVALNLLEIFFYVNIFCYMKR